jgi:streptomycin 6-kinase
VVLKLVYPHRESEGEAAALAEWDGNGAIRLIDSDNELSALLLERCEPGTPLSAEPADAALEVLAGLLPRLWIEPKQSFRNLAEEAQWWIDDLDAQVHEYRQLNGHDVFDAAMDALKSLPATQGEQVLIHQDLHGDNILAARREPWLVIDPKPLIGEREFALAPIIRAFEFEHSQRAVRYRRDFLCTELGLDRTRATGWALAQTVAWALDSDYTDTHLETARWLADTW